MNLSNNICTKYSAVYASPSSSSSSSKTESSITFSSISFNSANKQTIVMLETNGENYVISQSNIIHNSVPDESSNGLIQSNGPAKITDCCILNNKAKNIIAGYNGDTYLINCSLDFGQSKFAGSVSIKKTGKSSFIIPIVCTKKIGYCIASYDSAGGMTVSM